jgi:hypothetical protein
VGRVEWSGERERERERESERERKRERDVGIKSGIENEQFGTKSGKRIYLAS